MSYHYRESGLPGYDVLVVTKDGREIGGLPKGIILLERQSYLDRAFKPWLDKVKKSNRLYVSVAKHCNKVNEVTHISKDGDVNRFGYFVSAKDPFRVDISDYDISSSNWFKRITVSDYQEFVDRYFHCNFTSNANSIFPDVKIN